MNFVQLIENIKEDISNDKIELAIGKLKLLFKNSPLLYEIIGNEARHNDLKKRIRRGTISFDVSSIEKNKIRSALLELLEEMHQAHDENKFLKAKLDNIKLNKIAVYQNTGFWNQVTSYSIRLNVFMLIIGILGFCLLTFFLGGEWEQIKNRKSEISANGDENNLVSGDGNTTGNNNITGDNSGNISSSYRIGDQIIHYSYDPETGDTISRETFLKEDKVNEAEPKQANTTQQTPKPSSVPSTSTNSTSATGCSINNVQYGSLSNSLYYLKFYDKKGESYKYIGYIKANDLNGTARIKGEKIYFDGNFGTGEMSFSNACGYLTGHIKGKYDDLTFNGKRGS